MEEVSNCCGAARWMEEADICSDCKEHADFEDEDEYFGITCRNGKPIDQCECCQSIQIKYDSPQIILM